METSSKHTNFSPDDEVIRFSRTVALAEWLVLVLIFYYYMTHQELVSNESTIFIPIIIFTVFILFIRTVPFLKSHLYTLIAIETWMIIIFITVMIYYSHDATASIFHLYFLPIILSAIIYRPRLVTLQVIFIVIAYSLITYIFYSSNISVMANFYRLLEDILPLMAVAYLTSTLSMDINTTKMNLISLSQTDQLTGLLNLRAFYQNAYKETRRASRHNHPYTILMIDIDHLKKVNDKYGHEVGNILIAKTAACIKYIVRADDIVARYGGDEFIVLLVETDASLAKIIATRLKEQINTSTIQVEESIITLSSSIGMASYPDDSHEISALVTLADKAMYEQKLKHKSR